MQKSEDILVYDFYGHFEKFGLEWENVKLGFKHTIEKAGQKIKKKHYFYTRQQEEKLLLTKVVLQVFLISTH